MAVTEVCVTTNQSIILVSLILSIGIIFPAKKDDIINLG